MASPLMLVAAIWVEAAPPDDGVLEACVAPPDGGAPEAWVAAEAVLDDEVVVVCASATPVAIAIAAPAAARMRRFI
jgi:hypothetical protein